MGKRKIIEAAKKKGLTVESVDWGYLIGIGNDNAAQWDILFGPEIGEMYGQDQDQAFTHTAEALEWIDSLEPVTHGEDE